MKTADLHKRPPHKTINFATLTSQLLAPETFDWLSCVERLICVEWNASLSAPRTAAFCRESDWTRVHILQPNFRVLHELTKHGQLALRAHRRAREQLGGLVESW